MPQSLPTSCPERKKRPTAACFAEVSLFPKYCFISKGLVYGFKLLFYNPFFSASLISGHHFPILQNRLQLLWMNPVLLCISGKNQCQCTVSGYVTSGSEGIL